MTMRSQLRPRFALRLSLSPVSPVGLALISFAFCISAVLIPPAPYERLIGEPNRMFLNPFLLTFVAACTVAFAFGVALAGVSASRPSPESHRRALRPILVAVPLLAAIALNFVSLALLQRNNPDMMTAWLVQGGAAKFAFDTTGGFAESLMLLYAFSWWALWHALSIPPGRVRYRGLLVFALIVAFTTAIATSLFRVVRVDLFAGLTGALLLTAIHRHHQYRLPIRRLALYLLVGIGALLALFAIFAWLRRDTAALGPFEALVGYAYAPFNRLAAVLDGSLQYPFGGEGGYAFRFLDRIPLLSRWIDVGSLVGIPDKNAVQFSEYGAVDNAGLNRLYIWATAYGYLYSDLNVAVYLYFLALGILSGLAWRSLTTGSAPHAIIVAWMSFSILFWFGDNFVAYTRGVTVVIALAVVMIYERLLLPGLFGRRRFVPLGMTGTTSEAHRKPVAPQRRRMRSA